MEICAAEKQMECRTSGLAAAEAMHDRVFFHPPAA